MTELQIENGIPIPTLNTRGRKGIYPFKKMEIGQSFFVESNGNILTTRSRVCAAIGRAQKLLGWRFTYKSNSEGVRVWRTK